MIISDEQHDRMANRAYGKDRYVLIEPDGSGVQGWGSYYTQRPAAIRHARRGIGVYDIRERKVIVEPDLAERIEALREHADLKEREAKEIRDRIIELEVNCEFSR